LSAQALNQNPDLKYANAIGLISTNSPEGDNLLESWKQGELGTTDRPRPKELPVDQLGVQIFSGKTKPDDVAADIVSITGCLAVSVSCLPKLELVKFEIHASRTFFTPNIL